jgi:hypothetical protein
MDARAGWTADAFMQGVALAYTVVDAEWAETHLRQKKAAALFTGKKKDILYEWHKTLYLRCVRSTPGKESREEGEEWNENTVNWA